MGCRGRPPDPCIPCTNYIDVPAAEFGSLIAPSCSCVSGRRPLRSRRISISFPIPDSFCQHGVFPKFRACGVFGSPLRHQDLERSSIYRAHKLAPLAAGSQYDFFTLDIGWLRSHWDLKHSTITRTSINLDL